MKTILIFLFAVAFFASSAPAATGGDLGGVDPRVVEITLNEEHRNGIGWEGIVSDYHTVPLTGLHNLVKDAEKMVLKVGVVSRQDYADLRDSMDVAGAMTSLDMDPVASVSGAHARVSFKFPLSSGNGPHKAMDIGFSSQALTDGGWSVTLTPRVEWTAHDPKTVKGKPVTKTLEGRTELKLAPGSVIVIGGVLSDEEIQKLSKFPLLGDIPVVGFVFRSRGKLVQRTETVIFLIPRSE